MFHFKAQETRGVDNDTRFNAARESQTGSSGVLIYLNEFDSD